jgi:hypothetical protein
LVGWYSIETMCGQPVVVAMRSRRQIVHRNETRKRERFPAATCMVIGMAFQISRASSVTSPVKGRALRG